MKTIYKYQIPPTTAFDEQRFGIPKGGKILLLATQQSVLTFWVEVETDNPSEMRHFQLFGTGHQIPFSSQYVGTIQDGTFVWHLYEVSP